MVDKNGKAIPYTIAVIMPHCVPKFKLDRRTALKDSVAHIETVMKSVLNAELGGPVANIYVDGNIPCDCYKCGT